jgi:hypothetical protein
VKNKTTTLTTTTNNNNNEQTNKHVAGLGNVTEVERRENDWRIRGQEENTRG